MVARSAEIARPSIGAVRLYAFPTIGLALQQEGEGEDATGIGGHAEARMMQQGLIDDDFFYTIPMTLVFVGAANAQRVVGEVGR